MLSLGKTLLILDGGMGSELERSGICYASPEELNITHPELIQRIHAEYAEAGADMITANTFGLNRIKYRGEYPIAELVNAAIENARKAGKHTLFDIGPTGALLSPIGTLSFDEAYEAFREVVLLSKDKVDGYILETFGDLYELKAAVLAVKENSELPVIATMTFDKTARTLTGTSPEIMVELLEGLSVDALGVNCSLGPTELSEVIERILACAHIPVVIQPNRGIPALIDGKTVYGMTKEDFASATKEYIDMGVSAVGGCCGTTPEFIKELSAFKGAPVKMPSNPYRTAVTSARRHLVIRDVTVCGERLNPTGKKRVKEALLTRDYDLLVSEAIKEEEAGAELLDLNVGLPMTDEPVLMLEVMRRVQEYTDLPLQIDSSDPEAIERGARYYNGIPLINSVNGEQRILDAILPTAKKYGAAVLGLTLDENGIPRTAEERCEIAKRIIKEAERYGIPRHKIMIDTLVLTASAEQALVKETLRALTLVRELGVMTALGVSNVSFGLPNRPLMNRTFLSLAMGAGLTMPILNPLDIEMMGAVRAFKALSGIDASCTEYTEAYKDRTGAPTAQTEAKCPTPCKDNASADPIFDAIKHGLKKEAAELVATELAVREPLDIVNNTLIAALNRIGDDYSSGKIFLPQLISAAEAAKEAFAKVTEMMPARLVLRETVLLATVKGDIHDIGKNIVKTVLRSYGYTVIDLGRDVAPEAIVAAAKEHEPFAIGLSALMTTTVASMKKTVEALREHGTNAKIFVGGAVLTRELAEALGADFYTADALELVKVLEELPRDI